jgi:biopolymer transport protein ExbD
MIAADGAAQHRSVVRVIDLLRRNGVGKFAINVNPNDVKPIGN